MISAILLGAFPSTFAISIHHTVFEVQTITPSTRWSTTGKGRGTPVITCTLQRKRGWKRYKPFIASKVSILGESCTVDHIDHRFKIAPQPLFLLLAVNPRVHFALCGSESGICYPGMHTLTDATVNEPSNAASKNGDSLLNTILPTEMRTWLPESASYGRSIPRTSRCCQSFGARDGMSKSASLPS